MSAVSRRFSPRPSLSVADVMYVLNNSLIEKKRLKSMLRRLKDKRAATELDKRKS